MKTKPVLYSVLFAVFSFAAIFMVSRLNPGFELFTKVFLDVPQKIWFGDTQLLSYGISLGLNILALSSLAVAFLVLLAREEKPVVVSAIAGGTTLIFSILLFGFYTSTLLFVFGLFLGMFLFAGGAGKSLAKGERLSAGGKLVTAFFFVNLFVGIGTYLSFSQDAVSHGEVVFEKLVDNALVMMGKLQGGLVKGAQSQLQENGRMILDVQRSTVDATAYGMNQYLLAQGQQAVPTAVISTLKDKIADEEAIKKELSKVDVQKGLGINREMVRNILDPLLHSQLVALFPASSAFMVFFMLEFLRNGLKLLVPLLVLVLGEIEKMLGKTPSREPSKKVKGGYGFTSATDEGGFTSATQ